MKKLVIATRGSKLALWQAEHIKSCIEGKHPGVSVELLVLKTRGDIILDVPLAKVGGKGLFVKEIEEALLDGRADLAVHSMKDVPMELPEGLVLGIIPEREEPSDTFLSVHHASLAALPHGATVGTSSLRRQSQLLALRPDLNVVSLRGNVDTRLRKLSEGQFDAIIMATAGMKRLGLSAPKSEVLGPPAFLPAVGQGALGIEFRADRTDLHDLLAFLEHTPTRIRVEAERGFLAGLQGGCQVPIAGHAVMTGNDTFTLEGLVADLTGARVIRRTMNGKSAPDGAQARTVGLDLAAQLVADGAGDILAEVYGSGEAVN
ncbi:hydroxymethylbilane synthase [Nitratidesulfovibrio sp. HK-II]|uniref:hydroxymethylbilane synthase n=1 Tax=Nitratidesulfovibrio sp. HK-II TaxID=2009266 RepID=UPI000E2E6108|nr:hydroxymethylbilane synthase [Nitratidesulfovibrio sp. HK-II]GBO95709.1 porphobilinogen deaminase [Nitratidesulfovibrio sp. HK-II]